MSAAMSDLLTPRDKGIFRLQWLLALARDRHETTLTVVTALVLDHVLHHDPIPVEVWRCLAAAAREATRLPDAETLVRQAMEHLKVDE